MRLVFYVGGRFAVAGNVAVSNIARWDGASSTPLGSGTNDKLCALTVYNGRLIAEGLLHQDVVLTVRARLCCRWHFLERTRRREIVSVLHR